MKEGTKAGEETTLRARKRPYGRSQSVQENTTGSLVGRGRRGQATKGWEGFLDTLKLGIKSSWSRHDCLLRDPNRITV